MLKTCDGYHQAEYFSAYPPNPFRQKTPYLSTCHCRFHQFQNLKKVSLGYIAHLKAVYLFGGGEYRIPIPNHTAAQPFSDFRLESLTPLLQEVHMDPT